MSVQAGGESTGRSDKRKRRSGANLGDGGVAVRERAAIGAERDRVTEF
jgi:hypothetical protein